MRKDMWLLIFYLAFILVVFYSVNMKISSLKENTTTETPVSKKYGE